MAKHKLEYLVLHCTATEEGKYYDKEDVIRWHTSKPPAGRGWRQIGYHKLFLLDGGVQTLQQFDDDNWIETWEVTNGARGINFKSIHFCYVGGVEIINKKEVPKDTRTQEQRESLESEIKLFLLDHPDVQVIGHNQQTRLKACPSFDVPKWLDRIGVRPRNILYKPYIWS